jgi:hypothetical protein
MPIYHFDVGGWEGSSDLAGSEYPDLEGARAEAVRRSSDFIRDNALSFWGGQARQMVVTDAVGMILFVLHFFAVPSPATDHYGGHAEAPVEA